MPPRAPRTGAAAGAAAAPPPAEPRWAPSGAQRVVRELEAFRYAAGGAAAAPVLPAAPPAPGAAAPRVALLAFGDVAGAWATAGAAPACGLAAARLDLAFGDVARARGRGRRAAAG